MNRFWQSFFYGLIVTVAIMGHHFRFRSPLDYRHRW